MLNLKKKEENTVKKNTNKLIVLGLSFIFLRTFFAMVIDISTTNIVPTLDDDVFASETITSSVANEIFTTTPSNTPSPSATLNPTFTPTSTPHPASILGFGPERWSRTDADIGYAKGEIVRGFTQIVKPAFDGTISVNVYSPNLPLANDDWLGGQVSGAWPVDFDNRSYRMIGDCSHPCDVFLVGFTGDIIDQRNAGHIDVTWPAGTMDEGWIVIKPTTQTLDLISFRVGPFENPLLDGASIEGFETKQGHVLFGFVKPVGRVQFYLQEGIENSFETEFKRSDLGVLESDVLTAYYIIPLSLEIGDHDVKIECWHICYITFLNQNGNQIRQSIYMEWSEENQGIFTDLIGVPRDSGPVHGWIVIQQLDKAGPEIGVSIEIK